MTINKAKGIIMDFTATYEDYYKDLSDIEDLVAAANLIVESYDDAIDKLKELETPYKD